MNTETKAAKDLTEEELEQLLEKRRQAKKAAQERERKAYEAKRDTTVSDIIEKAITLNNMLESFKEVCHRDMEEQAKALSEYGKMPAHSKGGFSITDSTGQFRVTRRRDTEPHWDERSTKAVTLIREFLSDTVKKRDMKLHDILMSFLEKNDKGDLEYSRVMNLWQHEDKFKDPRWQEGLKLIKESYTTHLKGFGYEFKVKGTDGKWRRLDMNFSSL